MLRLFSNKFPSLFKQMIRVRFRRLNYHIKGTCIFFQIFLPLIPMIQWETWFLASLMRFPWLEECDINSTWIACGIHVAISVVSCFNNPLQIYHTVFLFYNTIITFLFLFFFGCRELIPSLIELFFQLPSFIEPFLHERLLIKNPISVRFFFIPSI